MSMKKLYHKFTFSVLIISLIISLPACGKKSNDISDYGNQNEATNSDTSDDVSGYGSLRDKFGTDKINWQESINVNGVNYHISIIYDVPEQENVPVYIAESISNLDNKEKEIVKNIFGDNYDEVHKIIKEGDVSEHIFIQWFSESELGNDSDSNTNPNEYFEEALNKNDFFDSWNKFGDFSLHTYKGVYDGTEYYALFSRYEKLNYIVLHLIKDDIAGFIGDDSIIDYTYYDSNDIWISGVDSSGNSLDKSITYNDEDNIAYADKEGLMQKVAAFSNCVVGGNYYEPVEIGDLAFYGYNYNGLYGTDIIKLDGYTYDLINNIDWHYVYDPKDLKPNLKEQTQNTGEAYSDGFKYTQKNYRGLGQSCDISSEGIIYACIGIFYDKIEVYSADINMLNFENIKEIVRENIKNEDVRSNDNSNNINIDKIELYYWPIQNPDNLKELMMIPVWRIYSTTKSFSMTINAVDGSLISY